MLKFSPPQISPKLVPAELGREVNIERTISIDVRDGEAVAVIVMRGLIILAGIIDDVVFEPNLAFSHAVGELEAEECLAFLRGQFLLLFALVEELQSHR